jgi:hypothetical protein
MPRKPKEIKKPLGRPRAEIDWKVVDDYLECGCSGAEIAARLGISGDALYNRVEEEFKTNFSAYSQQKKQSGEVLLKKAQFDKAIGRTEHGDNTLLIWLGKTRLDQRETTAITVAAETEKNYRSLMEDVAEMQRNRQNVASTKIEEATNESGND